MKTVDHSYEQALIMHDNVHIHVIMNIIMTPSDMIDMLSSCHVAMITNHQVTHRKNIDRRKEKFGFDSVRFQYYYNLSIMNYDAYNHLFF